MIDQTPATEEMAGQESGGHYFSLAAELADSPAALAAEVRTAGSEAQSVDAPIGTADVVPSHSLRSTLGQPLAKLLKRPEITIETLAPAPPELRPDFFGWLSSLPPSVK